MAEFLPGAGIASSLVAALSALALLAIAAVIVFAAVKLLRGRGGDRKYPVLMVDGRLASKRIEGEGEGQRCLVTFALANGGQLELHLAPEEYEQLREGDYGKVTFQGETFVSFIELGDD